MTRRLTLAELGDLLLEVLDGPCSDDPPAPPYEVSRKGRSVSAAPTVDPYCKCGHVQSWHYTIACAHGCGCEGFRPRVGASRQAPKCPALRAHRRKACGQPLMQGSDLCDMHARRRSLGIAVVLSAPMGPVFALAGEDAAAAEAKDKDHATTRAKR